MKKYILLIVCVLTVTACEKYVDIKKSGSQSFIETTKDCQLILDNYDLFNINYPVDGEIAADDYYLDDNRYNSDVITLEDKALYTWQPNAIRAASTQWVASYNKIYHCNLVLEALEKIKGTDQPAVISNLQGSALFLRAYALWPLAQMYIKPYGAATMQEPGLPIHTRSDINDVPGRGTVKETYDAIVNDLTQAAGLLSNTSSISSRPNKAAALAMLARVYLSMEDYPNALSAADAALKLKSDLLDYNTLELGSYNPFPRFNKEVIFHAVIDHQNSVLEVGFGDENKALIDPVIISAYQNDDLRKQLLVKENLDVPVPSGTYRFIGNYEGAVGSSALFNGLAVDELYLVRAECYARAGQTANAVNDMNTLLATRWVSGTYPGFTVSSAADALNKILLERRKELLMRGLRWTDLRRLNKDSRFAKNLSRVVNGTVYTLPANDPRYTLLIPQEVITNSKLPQNSR
ncbi:RagB/SusD family nutrient uptake outer membrane protein [Chitinophaga ginsengisegetis]|uniref:RagB/SusD family nutrient uptake outer membrane protein n=1 Tax=Chitinophaga ginsengisegetis TaxID=393003 RepID=UPI000DBA8D99|nr:RagB/SusD family nutrient uptake outer membrane protein [Chitinophaga ginsengisegetis]MDR6568719.1 tetratricopeptide (TPR) repeat protein [Chitinophaga ginsengisegetis]MDR6648050.1 tetratricopeptide (TPR) repeat protein [Chitinophaga ginsengisegetis]MDR6654800.1 tetratricopeptide (TPR) repeat protein [Chitinophaga ginsengisegetis]